MVTLNEILTSVRRFVSSSYAGLLTLGIIVTIVVLLIVRMVGIDLTSLLIVVRIILLSLNRDYANIIIAFATIVSACATLALVYVTARYVNLTKQLVDNQELGRKRNSIVDVVQWVVTPFIEQLGREIDEVKKHVYVYHYDLKQNPIPEVIGAYSTCKLDVLENIEYLSLEQLEMEYPDLKERIERNNKMQVEFAQKLDELARNVSSYLPEKIGEYILSLSEKNKGYENLVDRGTLVGLIVNGNETLEKNHTYNVVWNNSGKEIMERVLKPTLKQKQMDLHGFAKSFREEKEKLKQRLEEIRKEYKLKFSLSKDEMKPKYYSGIEAPPLGKLY